MRDDADLKQYKTQFSGSFMERIKHVSVLFVRFHFALGRIQKGKLPHSSDGAERPVCKSSENETGKGYKQAWEDLVVYFLEMPNTVMTDSYLT